MNIAGIVSELKAERNRLDQAIDALEGLSSNGATAETARHRPSRSREQSWTSVNPGGPTAIIWLDEEEMGGMAEEGFCKQVKIVVGSAQGSSGYKTGRSDVIRTMKLFDQATAKSLRTEKPAESAASANRWSPQMKLLLEGRRSHQISEAASCRLSAARKEY